MKLRIRGNSLRIRLSKTEVDELASGSSLTEYTNFGSSTFSYKVQAVGNGDALTATYEKNMVTLNVPTALLADWPTNSVVGFESMMPLGDSKHLHLLLEKDFKCIDKTMEDQSDFFENPAKTC
jgi:hypothetical protein